MWAHSQLLWVQDTVHSQLMWAENCDVLGQDDLRYRAVTHSYPALYPRKSGLNVRFCSNNCCGSDMSSVIFCGYSELAMNIKMPATLISRLLLTIGLHEPAVDSRPGASWLRRGKV